jgi:anti-sigma B factor antagonist
VNEPFFWERRSLDAELELFLLRGELDSSAAPDLRVALRRLFEDGGRHSVVFDLGEVTFVDSVGLGVFFAAHRMAERCGAVAALACVKDTVSQSLESTGLSRTMFLAPTRSDAIIYATRAAHGHRDALEQAREDAANL